MSDLKPTMKKIEIQVRSEIWSSTDVTVMQAIDELIEILGPSGTDLQAIAAWFNTKYGVQ